MDELGQERPLGAPVALPELICTEKTVFAGATRSRASWTSLRVTVIIRCIADRSTVHRVISGSTAHGQSAYSLRMEGGLAGAAAVVPDCDIAVVVDVLSFTTTLTVAADRGVVVYPLPWRKDAAATFAAARAATLAVGRSEARAGQVSLSPASIRNAQSLERLVLPSPNGSSISFELARSQADVLGCSLRNRAAVASWIQARRAAAPDIRVAIIPAGEKWPDRSLRPAVEDLWGAGALISALHSFGWTDLSPEAFVAATSFETASAQITQLLRECASGRELIDSGYEDDVQTASELDSSSLVPILRGDMFVANV